MKFMLWQMVVVGLVSFYAGFAVAAIMAAGKREDDNQHFHCGGPHDNQLKGA